MSGAYLLCHPVRFMYSTRSRPSCNLALFIGDTIMMKDTCQLHYNEQIEPINQIQQLGTSDKLLITAVEKQFIKHCEGGSQMVPINACTFCIVNLPCGCIIKSSDGILPAIRADCTENTHQHETFVQYPVNLLFLSNYLSTNALQEFNGSALFDKPSKAKLPYFEIMKIRSKNVAAIEQEVFNLRKVTESVLTDNPVFASGEAYIDEPDTVLEQIVKTPYAGLSQVALVLMNIVALSVSAIAYLKGKALPIATYAAVSTGKVVQSKPINTDQQMIPVIPSEIIYDITKNEIAPQVQALPTKGAPSFAEQLHLDNKDYPASFNLHYNPTTSLFTDIDHLLYFLKPYITLLFFILALHCLKVLLRSLWLTVVHRSIILPVAMPRQQDKTRIYLRVYNTVSSVDIYITTVEMCSTSIRYLQQQGTRLRLIKPQFCHLFRGGLFATYQINSYIGLMIARPLTNVQENTSLINIPSKLWVPITSVVKLTSILRGPHHFSYCVGQTMFTYLEPEIISPSMMKTTKEELKAKLTPNCPPDNGTISEVVSQYADEDMSEEETDNEYMSPQQIYTPPRLQRQKSIGNPCDNTFMKTVKDIDVLHIKEEPKEGEPSEYDVLQVKTLADENDSNDIITSPLSNLPMTQLPPNIKRGQTFREKRRARTASGEYKTRISVYKPTNV